MTETATTTSPALRVALAYHRAWSAHDIEAAMTLVDPEIVCDSPGGPVHGLAAFRDFMAPFARSTSRTEVLGAFGDDETAVVLYDTSSTLVEHAPGAEWVHVVDGRIARMTIVFDRLPFAQARAAAAPPHA